MNEIEQKIKNARLAMPSAELDRRIAGSVAVARRRQQVPRGGFWWWAAALTAAGGVAAMLMFFAPRSLPAPAVAVYQIEAQGRLREMLLNPPATREVAPPFVFHVAPPGTPTTPAILPL
jgi:hypothetical protein